MCIRDSVDARLWDSQGMRSESSGQMVPTIEGGAAFIQVGHSLPVPMRQATLGPGGAVISESVVFQDIGRGFFATPRLNGERVTIDISQQADSVSRFGPPGTVSTPVSYTHLDVYKRQPMTVFTIFVPRTSAC